MLQLSTLESIAEYLIPYSVTNNYKKIKSIKAMSISMH